MACPRDKSYVFLRPKQDFLFYFERDDIRNELFANNVPLCVWCQETVGDWRSNRPFTADHIENRHTGGAYSLDNLALACKNCNTDRGSLSVLAYMHKRALRAEAGASDAGEMKATA
ncbi:hypothetical protein GOB57_08145 [Sinorhizobium meliloti]|nr:hypothetical protein [Sinorhizobium meliloti]